MNRANFLKQASLLGLGAALIPNFSFGVEAKTKYKIGIIGAGITGLYLADILKQRGHQITVLEAKKRAGGRIFEDREFYSSPIDLGAQWIHGNKNELYKIVKKSQIPIYIDRKTESIKISYKGAFLDDFPTEFYQFIKEIEAKTPLQNDISVLDFAKQFSNDVDFIGLIENLVTDTATKAESFSINEISKMTKHLNPVDYQFADTTMYGFFNKRYISGLKENMVYNFPVSSIDYTSPLIKVSNKENQSYEFDKIIITIPITVLKSQSIQFAPELPDEKYKAFEFIGMDKGLKVFLKFEKQFFKHSIFNGKYAGYYIDPSKNEASSQGCLASLVMGIKAKMYYENPQKAVENYLADLDAVYDKQASKYFVDMFAQDWGSESHINGVYSYTKPGGVSAREIARRPIANKIFFAGEAMNTRKNYGTVHGAIETAMEVLKELA